MTGWTALLVQVALTVAGAATVGRVRFLRERPVAVGLLFGVLSVAFWHFPIAEIEYYEIDVSLRLTPVFVAGFFFGPVAGLICGGMSLLAGLQGALEGYRTALVVCSALGTVAATLYAVAVGKWLFGDRHPPLCTAVIAAAYGIVIHLAFGALFGLDDLPTALEVVLSSFTPQAVGAALAAGLVAVFFCGTWRGWWRGLFSSLNLAFLFVGLAVSVTSAIIVLNAGEEGVAIVRHASIDLSAEMEGQARYMLHESAVTLAETLSGRRHLPKAAELASRARDFGLSEITVADTNGTVLVTTDKSLVPGEFIEQDADVLRRYRKLCSGSNEDGFVCLPYRPGGTQTNDWVKSFAYPLPGIGLLRLSLVWSSFQAQVPLFLKPALEDRNVGETGFYLLFGEKGVTTIPVPGRPETKGLTYEQVGLNAKLLAKPYEEVFRARILGMLCRCMGFEPFGGHRLFAVLPLAETQGPALVISTIVALVLMAICVVFRLVLVRFQQAQAKIDALRTEKERQRAADLELARVIQLAELRTDGTRGDGYSLASLMHAAREVGGDFYDYYELPDGRLVVTIADVSGKGIPAAFFMMKSRMTLKSCVHSTPVLAEAVATANLRLAANNPAFMFVTAWVGVYDRRTGTLDFVSAGHNPPLVRRASGVEWLEAPRSPAMGMFANARYVAARTTLAPGDRLFLYTDGVTEAMNVRAELLGDDRLKAALETTEGDIIPVVAETVRQFADGAEQADDITMLELTRT